MVLGKRVKWPSFGETCKMATKIQTKDLYALINYKELVDPNLIHQAYNGLDSAVTLRVHHALFETIRQRNDPCAATSYLFTRAMQGPAMDMMLRGIAINQRVRQDETLRLVQKRDRAQQLLDRLADAIWGPEEYTETVKTKELQAPIGKRGVPLALRFVTVRSTQLRTRPRGLNPNSSPQLLAFFNIALKMPTEYEIRKTPLGSIRTASAADNALRKWAKFKTRGPGISPRDHSFDPVLFTQPFVSLILSIREIDKQLNVLRTPLDPDGRMRCSYNPVGTETGRWSSSKNAFGRGSNLQNISDEMRRIFNADDGFVLIDADLKQAESYLVAGLVWQTTGDRTYLDACESSDLHTTVCTMTWPELDWTDDETQNRQIAERWYPNLGGLSYRDVAKRIGHGSNYFGTPFGISQAVGIPGWIVDEFQHRYFAAFPRIKEWHAAVKAELRSSQTLDTPLYRRRIFFDRPNEDSTLRKAIAFVPQSTVAELLNLVLYRCWRRSLRGNLALAPVLDLALVPFAPCSSPFLPIQLLLQNHDGFLFQTHESNSIPAIIQNVNEEFQRAAVPLKRPNGETLDLVIPAGFSVGWNWAKIDPERRSFIDGNPDGLAKWKGTDSRHRRQGASVAPADWLRPTTTNFGPR